MVCSVCSATPKFSPGSSLLLSRPIKCPQIPQISFNFTSSRGRISMAMATPGPTNSNDLIIPGQKLITPENPSLGKLVTLEKSSDVLPPLYDRLGANMQSRSYQGKRVSFGGRMRNKRKSRPPDIPSMMLDEFIVFIGMPLVSLVTELIIAQLLYLRHVDAKRPIKIFINSTGTKRADGETVALENEGFAIYDAMMTAKNEIHTYCMGAAFGQACLLLAAGKKGKRYMLPHAAVRLEEPLLPGTGQIPAMDVKIKADKQLRDRDLTVKILAKHTGNSEEDILRAMTRQRNMNARRAIEFGVVDKILVKGADNIQDAITLEEWDKKEGVQVVRPYGERENV